LFCTETHGKCFYFGAKTECSLSRALSSIKQRNDVSGVRVRLFDKGSGFFSGDKFCGQVVVRLNLANLRAPESASMPLQKRLGHPKDVVSGAIEFAIAFEDTASKTTTKNTTTSTSTSTGSSSLRAIELDNDEDDDDESTTRKDNDDDDDDDDDKTDDIVADDSKPNEFADLIFGGHTPVVTAAVAAVAAAKEAAVASSPASERRAVTAVAPAVTGEQLKDSILFNDVAIEEALCGASFVIVPKDDECDSVRDGPAAVELQPLGVASSHGKRGKARSERATLRTSAGHKLVLAGDGAVCSNVRLLADRWYFEVTVLSVGARLRDSASGNAHCRVGVCVSSTDRAVFVDGAAVGESALASSVCAGEVDDAAAPLRRMPSSSGMLAMFCRCWSMWTRHWCAAGGTRVRRSSAPRRSTAADRPSWRRARAVACCTSATPMVACARTAPSARVGMSSSTLAHRRLRCDRCRACARCTVGSPMRRWARRTPL
jgi:hypothetical protein